jgi:hypothetical protein
MKKWECAFVRTSIELPDPLFREVKATAARQGMRLKDYVTEALQDKLAKRPTHAEKPWMKFAGIAANDPEMVAELRRIEQIVDENFEQIEEEEWKGSSIPTAFPPGGSTSRPSSGTSNTRTACAFRYPHWRNSASAS